MTKRLIINADDFGLTPGINRSVQELARGGALTSATLMANSSAFDEAVRIAQANPQLGVGCHVVLTDGVPVSSPREIPSLIGRDGRSFRTSLAEFWLAVLLRRVHSDDVEREARAQIQRIQSAGLQVTHLDTHKHTHILPAIAAPLLRTAEDLGVLAVRNPFEERWSLNLSYGNVKRDLQVRLMSLLRKRFETLPQIRRGVVKTTDGTIGISATGRLDAQTLGRLLKAMPHGTWELVCHPGHLDAELCGINTRLKESRETEFDALRNAFSQRSSNPFGFELIHYGMLPQRQNETFVTQRQQIEQAKTGLS